MRNCESFQQWIAQYDDSFFHPDLAAGNRFIPVHRTDDIYRDFDCHGDCLPNLWQHGCNPQLTHPHHDLFNRSNHDPTYFDYFSII